MAKEIERKFLLKSDGWRKGAKGILFRQGYLSTHKERTVRVRVEGDRARLTIKGITEGASRSEYEYDLPLSDANELLDELCEQPIIEKTRYRVAAGEHEFEIDEFHGSNEGLVVAEIELASEQEGFQRPQWLGQEVTEDPRYYNANLVRNPYSSW